MTPQEIVDILKAANRIDKAVTIQLKDGRSLKAYTKCKYIWDYKESKRKSEIVVEELGRPYLFFSSPKVVTYAEKICEIGVESIDIPNPHLITIEEMADVFMSEFDIEDYSPELDDEDEMGRALGTGSSYYDIETEEDDFFINGEIYVRAHGYYWSGDYFNPPESDYEIDKVNVYISEAGWIDEEGDERLMSKEGVKTLEGLIQKRIA